MIVTLDIWSIIVAIATALTAFFLALEWYSSWKERKNKVWVTRFKESSANGVSWFIRVRAKKPEGVEDCTVNVGKNKLQTKAYASQEPIIIYGGGAENFAFWGATTPLDDNDEKEIVVREKNKIIWKRKFRDLQIDRS